MARPPTIRQQRYLALLKQLLAEPGASQETVRLRLGVSQGLVSAILREVKNAGEPTIDRARQRLRLSHEFFTDESLGDAPDYRAFVDGAQLRLVRDEGALRVVEEWLAGPDGDDVDEEDREWARGLSFRDLRAAGLDVTPSLISRLYRERKAQRAGRTVSPAPVETVPRPGRLRIAPKSKR